MTKEEFEQLKPGMYQVRFETDDNVIRAMRIVDYGCSLLKKYVEYINDDGHKTSSCDIVYRTLINKFVVELEYGNSVFETIYSPESLHLVK